MSFKWRFVDFLFIWSTMLCGIAAVKNQYILLIGFGVAHVLLRTARDTMLVEEVNARKK